MNSGSGVALAARVGRSTIDWLVYRKVRRSKADTNPILASASARIQELYNCVIVHINSIPDHELALARHPRIESRKSSALALRAS